VKPWFDPAARPLFLLTVVMAGLAAVACHLMLAHTGAVDQTTILVAVLVPVLALAVREILERVGASTTGLATDVLIVLGLAIAFLPLPLAGTPRDTGLVFRLLIGLRNAALVGAVLSDRPRAMRISALASVAVMLFAFSLGRGWGLLVAAVLFAGAILAWLSMSSWRDFARRLPPGAAHQAPWGWVLCLALVGGVSFMAGVLFYPAEAKGLLERLVPLDTGDSDRAKAAALHHGNRLALEDLEQEKYGPAGTGPGGSKGPTDNGSGEEAGQDAGAFSLVRAKKEAEAKDRVLFQYKGRGPGHLPLVSYDQTDGLRWQPEPAAGSQKSADLGDPDSRITTMKPFGFSLAEQGGASPLGGAGSIAGGGTSGDGVEDSRAALSALLLGLQGGGRLVNPEQRPADRKKIEQLLAGMPPGFGHADYLRLPPLPGATSGQLPAAGGTLTPEVRALLESWTAGRPRGWPQIDALIQGLRRHAQHDREATVPITEPDPLRYFLLDRRRGPDYLFASSAAVLLRALAYPSRMTAGFYVRPDDYRMMTGTTPVRASDVHFWTQVQMPGGVWINLEPTPGYEVIQPEATPWESVAKTANQVGETGRRSWPVLLSGFAVVALVFRTRWRLAERLATLWWRCRSEQPTDRLLRSTWRLIERRARLAGVGRRRGTTLPAWSARVGAVAPALAPLLSDLADAADRLLHAPAPAVTAGQTNEELRATCRLAVRRCSVGALRQKG
jgi:hypothetical protein